jgi:Bacterial SH3 domain
LTGYFVLSVLRYIIERILLQESLFMKKCPQCNTVYADDTVYCLNDGNPLIEENFALPTTAMNLGEEETVIRSEPIVIDFAENQTIPQQSTNFQPMQNTALTTPKSKTGNYLLFLILGLLIGGGIVLAGILLSRNIFQSGNGNVNRVNSNVKPTKTTDTNVTPINSKHLETNKIVNENELNGRVIKINAYVRSAPDANSPIIDTLPMNDRLKIGNRENENSPWYEITCEHGTTGWMHGNTIEFTE